MHELDPAELSVIVHKWRSAREAIRHDVARLVREVCRLRGLPEPHGLDEMLT